MITGSPLTPYSCCHDQLEQEEEDDEQREERNSQLYDFFHSIAGDNFEIDAFELKGVLTQVFQNGRTWFGK